MTSVSRCAPADSLAPDAGPALEAAAAARGVSAEDWDAFLAYVSQFLGNLGNYLSFGDSKFIPRVAAPAVHAIIGASSLADRLLPIWDAVAAEVYSLEPRDQHLGLGDEGRTTYYGEDVTKAEVERVQALLSARGKGDQAYNTRIFAVQRDGQRVLQLRIAAEETRTEAWTHDGLALEVHRGDVRPPPSTRTGEGEGWVGVPG